MSRLESLFARLGVALATLAAVLALTACGPQSGSDGPAAQSGDTLRILAGSEVQDLAPLKEDMARAAGMQVEFSYTGSLDAVEALESGEEYDAVWLSHGKYLQQTESLKPRIKASERIMTSPVILGVKRSKADALGWTKNEPTWGDVATAAATGKLDYAMTSPSSSNTGFTALVGVASALAGTGDALDIQSIQTDKLAALFKGQKFIAGSSGWLADAYVQRQGELDGLVNYESVILQLNAGGKLQEPLVPVYPKEGIVTADYPLMLLNDTKRDAYTRLVAYLRKPETQGFITRNTLRRPITAGVERAASIPDRVLIELPFPASRTVMDALLEAYQAQLRRPASTYFVLDVSGSMKGQGIEQLQGAIAGMAGDDTSLTGRFARFQLREQVLLLPFSDRVFPPLVVTMPENAADVQATLERIRRFNQSLSPDGGTAIFTAVQHAYARALSDKGRDAGRQYGIVLMTDGENTAGMGREEFLRWYAGLPSAQKSIPVFVVLFGDADADELKAIADATGGRVFDGRKSLRTAFKQIRGYL
ncbi:substrate-binding domain-containing protein [Thauera sinica]|uniref:Substrate-binding domain-containing protein n=1 Tax=Thauera sinica TaxID=2665146 RepID=A0ABW1AMN2_9RHOO|nr:substrate-binding domain-containing protein [Thauera sp. K11]ATE60672.1 VWA domain-containing protein [Thauera sp. K11]